MWGRNSAGIHHLSCGVPETWPLFIIPCETCLPEKLDSQPLSLASQLPWLWGGGGLHRAAHCRKLASMSNNLDLKSTQSGTSDACRVLVV